MTGAVIKRLLNNSGFSCGNATEMKSTGICSFTTENEHNLGLNNQIVNNRVFNRGCVIIFDFIGNKANHLGDANGNIMYSPILLLHRYLRIKVHFCALINQNQGKYFQEANMLRFYREVFSGVLLYKRYLEMKDFYQIFSN